MKPWELFKLIEDTEYISGGDDVQFAVKPVEEEKAIYLLFQESTSKRDWQVNLDFPVKVYKQQQKFSWCIGDGLRLGKALTIWFLLNF